MNNNITNGDEGLNNFASSIIDSLMVFSYFESSEHKSTLYWHTLNLSTKHIDTDSLSIQQKEVSLHRPTALRSLAFNQKYLALLFNNKVCVIEKGFRKKVIWEFEINPFSKNKCSEIKMSDNNILYLINEYNYSTNEDDSITINCVKIPNFEDMRTIKIPYSHIVFSMFSPTNRVDFCRNYFLVSNNISYKINIYDGNLKQICCLERPSLKWKCMDEDKLIQLNNKYRSKHDPSPIFNTLTPYFQDSINFVWYTRFINPKTIMVKYTHPGQMGSEMSASYDIWKLKDSGNWTLSDSGMIDCFDYYTKLGIDTFTKSNFTTGLNLHKYAAGGSKIVVIKKSSDINPIGMNIKKYYELDNSFFEKRDGIYTFYIFNLEK